MKKLLLLLAIAFCMQVNAQVMNIIAGYGFSGYSGDGGPALAAQLNHAGSITIDPAGNIYFVDEYRIRKINTSGIITTIAGTGTSGYSGDGGPATNAQIYPGSIVTDAFGNLYIADMTNRIRKIDTNGIITTIAGTGVSAYSGDGGPATNAQLSAGCITRDALGNLYFIDYGASSMIRKIDTNNIITTIAGNTTATPGSSGDGGPATAASLYDAVAITSDRIGNLYLVEENGSVVRKIDTSGIITTIAGTFGNHSVTGDGGPATAATFGSPNGIAIDTLGNIYISDDDFQSLIRLINTNGIISTYAGGGGNCCLVGGGSAFNNGLPATDEILSSIEGMALDNTGKLYISDFSAYSRIETITHCSNPITVTTNNAITTCSGDSVFLSASGATTYTWSQALTWTSTALLMDSTSANPFGIMKDSMIYYVMGIDASGNCAASNLDTSNIKAAPHLAGATTHLLTECQGHTPAATLTVTPAAGSVAVWHNSSDLSSIHIGRTYTPSDTTPGDALYVVYDSSSTGCISGPLTITVTIVPTPTLSFNLMQDAQPHVWDAYISFSNNIDSARWYWGDSSSSKGLYLSHIYNVAGNYNICVTAYSSCGDSVSYCQNDSVFRTNSSNSMIQVNVIDGIAGINHVSNSYQVIIYPNPSNGSFFIETNSTEKQTMKLFDVGGKLILTQTINDKTSIDASNLADGVYNLNMMGKDGVLNKKLIIIK